MMKERERESDGGDIRHTADDGERRKGKEKGKGKKKVMVGKSDSLPMSERGKGEDGEKGKERDKWWGVYQTHC